MLILVLIHSTNVELSPAMGNSRIPADKGLAQHDSAHFCNIRMQVWEGEKPANLGEEGTEQCKINDVPYTLKQLSADTDINIPPLQINIPRLRHGPLLQLG